MTKKKAKESHKDQSKRFLEKVQELVDAGELSPTEAEERFEKAMTRITAPQAKEEGDS